MVITSLLQKFKGFLPKISSVLDDILVFLGIIVLVFVTFQLNYYAGMYLTGTILILSGLAIGKARGRGGGK